MALQCSTSRALYKTESVPHTQCVTSTTARHQTGTPDSSTASTVLRFAVMLQQLHAVVQRLTTSSTNNVYPAIPEQQPKIKAKQFLQLNMSCMAHFASCWQPAAVQAACRKSLACWRAAHHSSACVAACTPVYCNEWQQQHVGQGSRPTSTTYQQPHTSQSSAVIQ